MFKSFNPFDTEIPPRRKDTEIEMAIFFVDALVKRASDPKAVNFGLLIKRSLELNHAADIIVDRLAKPNADDVNLAEQKAALRAMDSALAILNAFIDKKKTRP